MVYLHMQIQAFLGKQLEFANLHSRLGHLRQLENVCSVNSRSLGESRLQVVQYEDLGIDGIANGCDL